MSSTARKFMLPVSSRLYAKTMKPTFLKFGRDRKSTRLNSSHLVISYAVFCLKKKKHLKDTLGGRPPRFGQTRDIKRPVLVHRRDAVSHSDSSLAPTANSSTSRR